jgi:predicted nucleotidyltransferase
VSDPWREPPWRPTAVLDAAALLRVLVEHEVEFVVIGGLAVSYHGLVRATRDLDVCPAPDGLNRSRLDEALAALSAETLLDADGGRALLTPSGRVDVLRSLAGVDGYEQLRANAEEVPLPQIGVLHFAAYDDLVAMKRAANRPEDQLDLDRLARIREDPAS